MRAHNAKNLQRRIVGAPSQAIGKKARQLFKDPLRLVRKEASEKIQKQVPRLWILVGTINEELSKPGCLDGSCGRPDIRRREAGKKVQCTSEPSALSRREQRSYDLDQSAAAGPRSIAAKIKQTFDDHGITSGYKLAEMPITRLRHRRKVQEDIDQNR